MTPQRMEEIGSLVEDWDYKERKGAEGDSVIQHLLYHLATGGLSNEESELLSRAVREMEVNLEELREWDDKEIEIALEDISPE